MEDLISRQAAIDEIARWIGYFDEDMINRIQIGLKRLPSAQADSNESSNTQKALDTISRQAAIDALAKNMPSLTTPDGCGEFDHDIQVTDEAYVDCMQIIHELPSAQPQRMRAKWIATTSLQEGQITWRDYKCSNCSHHREKPMNFCEVCGAKMER